MARRKNPEGKMDKIGLSLQKQFFQEVQAIREHDEYVSDSRTAAFLVRIGLCLYWRSRKHLTDLTNEQEAIGGVERNYDHDFGRRIQAAHGDLQERASATSGGGTHDPVGRSARKAPGPSSSVRKRIGKKR